MLKFLGSPAKRSRQKKRVLTSTQITKKIENDKEPSISFTLEVKNKDQLPLLDVLIRVRRKFPV